MWEISHISQRISRICLFGIGLHFLFTGKPILKLTMTIVFLNCKYKSLNLIFMYSWQVLSTPKGPIKHFLDCLWSQTNAIEIGTKTHWDIVQRTRSKHLISEKQKVYPKSKWNPHNINTCYCCDFCKWVYCMLRICLTILLINPSPTAHHTQHDS